MKPSTPRRLVTAVAAAGLLVGIAVVAPSGASAATCSATKVSKVTIHAKETRTKWTETYDSSIGGGGYTNSATLTLDPWHQIAHHTLTFTACKATKTGKWTTLSAYAQPANDEVTLQSKNGVETPVSSGGIVFVKKITSTSVHIEIAYCAKKPDTLSLLGVFRGLTSIPLPIPYAGAVIQTIANKALPQAPAAKYYCGDLSSVGADETLPLTYSSKGVASLSFAKAPGAWYDTVSRAPATNGWRDTYVQRRITVSK